jgi:hypothetical protein
MHILRSVASCIHIVISYFFETPANRFGRSNKVRSTVTVVDWQMGNLLLRPMAVLITVSRISNEGSAELRHSSVFNRWRKIFVWMPYRILCAVTYCNR